MAFTEKEKQWVAYYNCREFYSKYIASWFSTPLTRLLSHTAITPNQVTILMIITGVTAGVICALGTHIYFVIGFGLYIAVYILDTADGELARYKGIYSSLGNYLDKVGHYIMDIVMYMGCALGLLKLYNSWPAFYVTIAAFGAYIFDELSRDFIYMLKVEAPEKESRFYGKTHVASFKEKSPLFSALAVIIGSAAFYHMFFLCAVIDYFIRPSLFVYSCKGIFIIVYAAVHWIKYILRIRRIARMYKKNTEVR